MLAAALIAVGVAASVALAVVWRASGHAMRPARCASRWTLDDYPDIQAVEVVLEARDGVSLAGRFIRGRSSATIVLVHGYGGSQDEMLPVAAALHTAGFGVFTFDGRGCGRSEGVVTFGALECDDLVAVVGHLVDRPEVDADRIGVFGFSMGAATAILAAAQEPRIRAVVADSAWSSAHSWLRASIRSFLMHPRERFSPPSLKLVELRTGIDLDSLRPVDVVDRIGPRPLLLLHGDADTVVLPEDGDRLLAKAAEPKARILVQGAQHGDTIAPEGAACGPRVVAFFQRALNASEAIAV